MRSTAVWILALGLLATSPAWPHGTEEHPKQPTSTGEADHAAALGAPGSPKAPARTITVTMNDDMRFTPRRLMVRPGETVKLVAKSAGKLKHELVLGTAQELAEHAELMQKFPEMEHDDPNAVSVEPGETGSLLWEFTSKAGAYDFGCLVPGHYEAGMLGKILVR